MDGNCDFYNDDDMANINYTDTDNDSDSYSGTEIETWM